MDISRCKLLACFFSRFIGDSFGLCYSTSSSTFLNISNACCHGGEQQSTIAKRVELANPNPSQKQIWQSHQLSRFLATPAISKGLQDTVHNIFLPRSVGRADAYCPHENDFSSTLQKAFQRFMWSDTGELSRRKQCWIMRELKSAIRRLKLDRCGEEVGLTRVDSWNVKTCSAEFFAAYLASIVHWCVLHWGAACFMVKSFVTMLQKKTASKTNNWFQTNCKALLEQRTP